jgi:HD-GYP domain-containing protein (c-di-GMP phosphodiesterase class II)
MREQQAATIIEAATGLFKDNREYILSKWLNLINKEGVVDKGWELGLLTKGFEDLVDNFINHLSIGDIDSYYRGSALIAQSIAYNDISFHKFINAFHLFEDSYLPLIMELPKDKLVKYINSLDSLHHNTISIICEKYFEVKDNTIISLAKLIELRDSETGGHIERTRDYAVLLAKEMGYSRDFIDELYKSCLLHDIGKIGVKDSILLKCGKLTPEEFEEVKKHSIIGAQTIDKIINCKEIYKGYLLMAKDIAMYHHEKYDGSGYPEGLKFEQIPIAARILSLADAYDAIVSERPYKAALSHEEAVKRIKQDSGAHFDPEVVSAFLRISEEFRKIHYGEYGMCINI